MTNPTSPIFEMEMERLDKEIEKSGKQFYSALLGNKRRVKRKWLEISAMTNAHLLQTLPYRAMLGHVAKLAEERDILISEILSLQNSVRENDKDNYNGDGAGGTKHDEDSSKLDATCHCSSSTSTRKQSSVFSTEGEQHGYSTSARDEAIQTEESSFLNES